MRSPKLVLLSSLTVASLWFSSAFGEISVPNGSATAPNLIYIFGKQDDPDPWPSFGLVRQTPLAYVLNPNGDLHGDKSPDLIFKLGSAPAVTWSYWDGTDFEIAYSEWNGSAWTAPVMLTENAVDDLNPKIALDTGGRPIITWWRAGSEPAVFSIRRTSGSVWEAESQVSQAGEAARTPAIAVPPDGHPRYGYEIKSGSTRQVVVSRDNRVQPEDPPGTTPEIVATTPYTGDTNPIVETRGSRTWVTWVHSATQVGWSELVNGAWGLPDFEPYSGPDDIEAARFRIKNRLGP